MLTDLLPNVLAAIVYAILGIIIFIFAFIVLDRMTPGSLWKEIIDDHNTALAILSAGFAIGISIVIAAAIF